MPSRGLVSRRRLDDLATDLTRGTIRCITVWAGAGTGKTTVLDSWARMFASEGTSVIRATGAALSARLDALAASTEQKSVILVDDLHLAAEGDADALFGWLESTPGARLVVAGRYQRCASLVHLAARGELLELRTGDLAFTAEECGQLVAAHGLTLSPGSIGSLTNRTGGWATALAVAMPLLSAAADPAASVERFVDDNRAIGDYLMTEMLDVCTPRERRLLLAMAIDDRLPVDLVGEIDGREDTGAVLQALAQRHQFLTLTEDDIVFHPVLGTFLRAEARRETPSARRAHHDVAARWFARRGRSMDALRHAASSGNTALLAEVFESSAVDLILAGHSGPIQQSIQSVPDARRSLAQHTARLLMSIPFTDRLRTARDFALADAAAVKTPASPWAALLSALHVLFGTDTDEIAVHLAQFASPAVRSARLACFGLDLIFAAAEGWAHLLAGDARTAIDRFDAVADSAHQAGYCWLSLQASIFASDAAVVEGEWEEAAALEDTMVERAKARSLGDRAKAAATVITAGRQYQRCLPLPQNDLNAIVEADSAKGALGLGAPARALQLLEALDGTAPRAAADELEDLLRVTGRTYPRLLAASMLRLTSIRVDLGDRRAACELARFAEPILGGQALEMQLTRYILDAPAHPEACEWDLLAGVGSRSRSWHAGAVVGAWLLLAAHAERAGKHLEAERRLVSAATHAKRYRAIRPFRARNDEGAALLASQSGRLGHAEDFARLVIERVRDGAPVHPGRAIAGRLTRRELEILTELPLHQSLSEIAQRQHLSANTVKTHVRSIYQKLGVAERSAAVTAARDLGLL